jgi:hypothetical protein
MSERHEGLTLVATVEEHRVDVRVELEVARCALDDRHGTAHAGSTPTVIKTPMLSASVPIARYLRWRLTSTNTPWDATFRIIVAANSPGM